MKNPLALGVAAMTALLLVAPSAAAWFPTAAGCDGVSLPPEHPGHGIYDQACVGEFTGLGSSCNGAFVGPHVNFDDQPGDQPELWLVSVCVGSYGVCQGVYVERNGEGWSECFVDGVVVVPNPIPEELDLL